MKLIRNIPWPHILAEGVIIVVSILLAFSIDAWWNDRQDRIEESELIALIHAEAVANRELFSQYRQLHQGIVDAGKRLLERTGPDATIEAHATEGIVSDLALFTDWWTVQPSVGAISSIIQSGQISLIQSEKLRIELAAWESHLEDLRVNEETVLRLSDGAFGEYWYENAPYRSLISLEEIGESRFAVDIDAILRDRRFESLVSNKLLTETTILDNYTDIEESTERLTRLSSRNSDEE